MPKPVQAVQQDSNRQTSSLAALLVVIVISGVIIRELQVRSMMEECTSSQRPGCMAAVDRLRVSLMVDRLLGYIP